jgi:hypothetical protein
MFARIIQGMTAHKKSRIPITPTVRRLSGIIKLPEGKTDREIITEALLEKYGLD